MKFLCSPIKTSWQSPVWSLQTTNGQLLFIAFFLCCCFYGHAQNPNYVWARNSVGTNAAALAEGFAIASNAQDNVFITGYYAGTTTFGTFSLSGGMPYLSKYDGFGNVRWAKDGIGRAFNRAVNTDILGNAYVAGDFMNTNTVTFGTHTLACTGRQDLYIVKYDTSGNVKWALNTNGTSFSMQEAESVAADAFGNAYLVGDFDSRPLYIGSDSVTTTGGEQVFIAKIDTSGSVLWARSSSGNGVLQNALNGNCVATDNAGNVYILGAMRSTSIVFGSITVTGATGSNVFLVKYDASGNVVWGRAASGASSAFALATDSSDNSVYITGKYTASATFGSITLTNAGSNTFLAKYDTAGTALWVKSINGPNTVYGIAPNQGRVYVSGKFTTATSAPVTFDAITITQPPNSIDPAFFAGYSSTGSVLFARTLTSGGDDNNGIAASPQGCIYIGGDFQPNPFILGSDTLSSAGHENAFVAKLCYSSSLPVSHFSVSQSVFCEGGGCISFYDSSSGSPTSWEWLFPGASPNMSNVQNPTNICYNIPGTYPVTLIVTNLSGSDTLTVSPMIIVSSGATLPVVSISNDTMFSSHATAYQWNLNGSPIAGATDSFYVCSQAGTYSVRITDSIGCSALSNGVYNSCMTGISEFTVYGLQFTVYPNPATDQFTVYSLQFTAVAMLEIYNVLGEQVYSEKLNRKQETVNCKPFPPGVYIIKITSENSTSNKKLIKK